MKNSLHHLWDFSAFLSSVLVLTGLLVVISSNSVAQEMAPIKAMTSIAEQNSTSGESLAQLRSRLMILSNNILKRMSSEGVSEEIITEQRVLQRELSSLLEKSSASELQPLQSTEKSTNEPDSPVSNGSGSSSSGEQSNGAGQAATTNNQGNQTGEPLQLREKLADAVWGHLPPQERNDLIRTYSESYLPEYEDQVRSYFEKLSKLKRGSFQREPVYPEKQ